MILIMIQYLKEIPVVYKQKTDYHDANNTNSIIIILTDSFIKLDFQ